MNLADVLLWGRRIGAVSVESPGAVPVFQYTPEFARSGIEVSPVRMPLAEAPYRFPELLALESFAGLPGLLADSLPDRWGRTLVDSWLRSQQRAPESFDVVERLCYLGTRGMGALEFEPLLGPAPDSDTSVELDRLVELANEVLDDRARFEVDLGDDPSEHEIMQLLSIGTSAGGARPKAVVAFNESTGQMRSGQVDAGSGFEYWILKFDGVARSGDHGLVDPQGWGVVEYAYSRMARAAGIDMTETRLLDEGPRRHFMTKRFDRDASGRKIHMQTVAALEHVDYNEPGLYSYERLIALARKLGLDARATEEIYRRMVFNVVARNQDDHVKNFAFMMDRTGQWALSPAYDVTWSYKAGNLWLEAHQMTINRKREDFVADDLFAVARAGGLKRGRDRKILEEVTEVVREWPAFADDAGVDERLRDAAAASHRLSLTS